MNIPDNELQIVRREITELYRPAVNRIVEKIEGSPLTVITGFAGDGKSTTLLPLLARTLTEKGFDPYLCGGEYFRNGNILDIKDLGAKLPATKNGVLIIDEAGDIIDFDDREATLSVIVPILQVAHDRNYRVASSLAFYTTDSRNIGPATQIWQLAEQEVSGEPVPAVNLPPFRLSSSLARRLLEAVINVEGREVSKGHVDYFLDKVPGNLRIVGEHAPRKLAYYFNRPLRALIMDMTGEMQDGSWSLMLTSSEINVLRKSLLNDLWLQ